MKLITLNIGLEGVPGKNEGQRVANVIGNIDHYTAVSRWWRSFAVYTSDTERTVVVQFFSPGFNPPQVEALAVQLKQEAIACYVFSENTPVPMGAELVDHFPGEGMLLGPKAAEWGAFNPDRFITVEGEYLSGRELA